MKKLNASDFNQTIDNQPVSLFTLQNSNGMCAQITNYGGRVASLFVSDSNGNFRDVVLGYDSLNDYIHLDDSYFGAIIGRYGNRIAKGRFTLDGKTYTLAKNNGNNHIHGGINAFHNAVWKANQISETELELSHFSVDGEEGFPGNVSVKVTYTLTNQNGLHIAYSATTDQATPFNLTNHSYFNLNGAGSGVVNDHLLQIDAQTYTAVDSEMIPTGVINAVKNSPFDFTIPTTIGERINEPNQQLDFGKGYDHNFIIPNTGIRKAATISSAASGISMEVYTNEPGIQLYTGNYLNVKNTGKHQQSYLKRSAFCLETQHYPNSPNIPSFPSTTLHPDEVYHSICEYRFGVVG